MRLNVDRMRHRHDTTFKSVDLTGFSDFAMMCPVA